jgi:hypothetical protein
VVVGHAANHVGVAHVVEGARAPRHAQILKAVFGQDRDLRWPAGGKVRLETGDATVEDRRVPHLHHERLPEFQEIAAEVQKVDSSILVSPVPKQRLAAIQARDGLVHEQAEQSGRERAVVLSLDGDRWSRSLDPVPHLTLNAPAHAPHVRVCVQRCARRPVASPREASQDGPSSRGAAALPAPARLRTR